MDCSVISPMALMLFGGDMRVQYEEGHVLIDDWIRIRVAAPTAVLVKKLRQAVDFTLKQKVHSPAANLSSGSAATVDALCKLLKDEESAQQWNI